MIDLSVCWSAVQRATTTLRMPPIHESLYRVNSQWWTNYHRTSASSETLRYLHVVAVVVWWQLTNDAALWRNALNRKTQPAETRGCSELVHSFIACGQYYALGIEVVSNEQELSLQSLIRHDQNHKAVTNDSYCVRSTTAFTRAPYHYPIRRPLRAQYLEMKLLSKWGK